MAATVTPDNLGPEFDIGVQTPSKITLKQANLLARIALKNCAGGTHGVGATIPSCAEMTAAIAAAISGISSDKFLQGLASYDAATNIITLQMSDGSTVPVDLTSVVSDAVAQAEPTRGAGAPVAPPAAGLSTIYIDTSTAPDTLYHYAGGTWNSMAPYYMEDYVHAPVISPNTPTRINPLVTTHGAVPSSAVFSNLVNCTATLNADGTHTVTVGPGACATGQWSYDYTTTVGGTSDTAHVSGVSPSGTTTAVFAMSATAGQASNVAITTQDGSGVTINWGEGAPVTAASGVFANHAYVSAYTGPVTVTYSVCTNIAEFRTTAGGWTGSIASLPAGLTVYVNTGANTTSGSIASLPSGLTYYSNNGANTTSGSIASLPSGLTYYSNNGANTTSGSIASLPAGLTVYVNTGSNTTSGSIASLPTGLTYYWNSGSNTTSGSIASLPSGLTYYTNDGSNTTSGSIASLPSGLTDYVNTGSNTTSGSIASLPTGLTAYVNTGSNTTSGSIASLPSGLTYYSNTGSNTTSGSIASLPSGLTYYSNTGSNTTSGSIASLPSGLTYYSNTGSNTTTATSAAWGGAPTGMKAFILQGTTARPQVEVDFALAALATIVGWATPGLVDLAGLNASPSPAGNTSKATILANGASVVTTN